MAKIDVKCPQCGETEVIKNGKNTSGIRDISRVLEISQTKVITTLKKLKTQ